jgi:CAAX protease family protein
MLKTSRAKTGGGSAERPAERDGDLGGFVRRHGLVSFYALAFGLSWLAWLPYILSQDGGLGVLGFSFPKILGTSSIAGILPGAYLGPLGAAFVVTAVSEGRPGLRRWVGRLFRWGVNWRWYALALLGVPAVIVAGSLAVSPGSAASLSLPPVEALLFYVPFLLIQMVTTGLAEEPGWRDFALVRHQRQQGPLFGTMILGVLWGVWHVPMFFTEWGAWMGGATPQAILLFVAFAVALSVVVTWLFNRTNGSLPLAIVAHVSSNTFVSLLLFSMFTDLPEQAALLGGLIGFGAVALVLVVATRGRLGYRLEVEPRADAPAGANAPSPNAPARVA